MTALFVKRYLFITMLVLSGAGMYAQKNVPLGIYYQAVARDNYGEEIKNRKISVRFSKIGRAHV